MIILFRLIVAHLIGDFILQPTSWIEDKRKKKTRSKFLYIHGIIHGLVAYLVLANWSNWYIPAIIALSHIIIDSWKINSKENTKNFVIDQILHGIVLIICWLIVIGQMKDIGKIISYLYQDKNIWIVTMGYMAVIWPMRFVIALATDNWRKEIQNEGLIDAGKWVGQIERILILTFVIGNKFEAIGFLIAAKSIFRFSDINKDRKEAEYILIGTLLSFALSIVWGIVLSYLLK